MTAASKKNPNGDGLMYDPEVVHQVNLSDPAELEAHIQVLDIRERLRARRRRAIRLFTFVFCVVVAALLTGLTLTSIWGKDNVGQAAAQQGEISVSIGTTLPSPSTDLAAKCSSSSLETPQGFVLCEAACEVADCCSVPEGFALSCASGNEDICSQYDKYCSILSKTSDMTFDKELKVSIDEACNALDPTMFPGSDCVALCQKGFCCFDDTTTLECSVNCQTYLNCTTAFHSQQQNGNYTQTTAPGSIHINNTINQGDSILKQRIDAICGTAIETVSPPGEDSCESLCSVSYCCFDNLCVPPEDMDCSEYSACYILFEDVSSVIEDITAPTLSDDVHNACSGLLDVNDAAVNEACQDICSPGACCFEDKLSCSDVDCAVYAECIVLHPSFIAVSKEEVADACQNHNDGSLQTDEPTLCEQVCTLHVMQCCFYIGGDCDDAVLLGDNSVYCDTYQACAILGTDGSSMSQSHKEELEAACSGGAPTRSTCIQLCSLATCCYSTSVKESCVNVDATVSCSDYKACDVLYG
jgi:hypothetical protein